MTTDSRKFLTPALLLLGAAVPVLLAVEATHQPACDRGCLIEFTNSYLDAMLAHNPSPLTVAPDIRITEDGKPASLGEGLWKTVKSIPSRQAFADPTTGVAGLFGEVIEQDGSRVHFAIRLKITRQQIEEIETVQ